MNQNSDTCLILLTYKNKVLLTVQEYDFNEGAQNSWSMIGVFKRASETFEEAIIRKIKKDMGIQLNTIDFLSVLPANNTNLNLYHGKLNDNNVNSIERAEGQEIQFYSLREVEKLALTPSTKHFFTEHKDEIERLLV